jgi:uncharacterized protein YutE (UPF0331/DUF86 family)
VDTSSVDKRVVRGQLALIRRSLGRLQELADLSADAFAAGADNFAVAEHHLRRSIEAAFDSGRHLVARLNAGPVTDYAAVPLALERAGILPGELAGRLVRAARLRNRLVHLYWQVGPSDVHALLADQIECLRRYCEIVTALLAEPDASDREF